MLLTLDVSQDTGRNLQSLFYYKGYYKNIVFSIVVKCY